MVRRNSQVVWVGKVAVGGEHPIVVQSMTTTDTRNIKATVNQIISLQEAGCELARVAVVDQEAARALASIKAKITIPLIADIHFDYRLALSSIDAGCDGLRINPGNIGAKSKVQEVVKACQDKKIPIRIGVNAGSLDKKILAKYGAPCPQAMVDSAMDNIRVLEDMGFYDIKVSLKASSVALSVQAYRMIAGMVDYPLHLGITEAGTIPRALVKSAMGLGILLNEGIGDTLRVSISTDPVYEVWAAYEILRSAGLRKRGVELISCPTCGRCEIDLFKIVQEVDDRVRFMDRNFKIAVMGCVVNGPGEARDADIGIAGGRGLGILFKKGKIIKKVPENELVDELMRAIADY
ncbi:MAG: flavodoxin-dependent (E)-4-hydroxy-3-methylbut-2-enyl-diphosphate synthase [Syntrophomonadaceae bacterium]|nr:flavodoxin-dependent (E)-4-hydroxy-3-methylbut-2-enyl-diphosphate synthase [Syntrophomonadaceae bacterium]